MATVIHDLKPTKEPLQIVSIDELIASEFPPRKDLLGEWLCSQTLNMLYAWRGVGKTHAALNIAFAVASGGEWLHWKAPKPSPILYLDGEMPANAIQQRLAEIIAASDLEPDPNFFRILTPDLNRERFMPDLATYEGQFEIEEHIGDAELIIVDNLSCLARRGGKENEAESWQIVADWALQQRANGRSVLFVHHAGKGGAQRGTSKREDILDTVIALKHPKDYEPREGARFELHFEKSRALHGDSVEAVEAKLETTLLGEQMWTHCTVEENQVELIRELKQSGMTVREIAEEVGISKSAVQRRLK